MLQILIFFGVAGVATAACPTITPKPDTNLTEWIRSSWYVQEQQVTDYQKKSNLFCVVATYNQEGAKVPFFSGNVVSVHNYANEDKVNGPASNANNKTVLCAREKDPKEAAKLLVAPCFLPNLLAGDYWVLAAGPSNDNYEWAVVTGGQPTVQYPDGCTTKTDSTNNAGLWIFNRKPVAPAADMETAKSTLVKAGYTLSQLIKVPQDGCYYKGAFIKE
mmetsp:Transcript_36214/g.71202  ORF Transcript_36214/g.71202 Transcript_36214/m.71202 type:complete len:218 (-) Transcript_36214:49-702(-)|eukprot:CAMPEP_0175146534 /NCGR_PEP_ID=MMETSP0087-20121206/15433_1 /TAXON_ID=136419 /ORGANISM="Unknown Unknown, Strain D1" /LENGTH=217 /DNA_ID=CAMNT_0016431509 /DNA_START=74 /DNA_END=727 /DNA_ORIENTATION=+